MRETSFFVDFSLSANTFLSSFISHAVNSTTVSGLTLR